MSVVWKLLTSIIYQKIYFHLHSNNLFPLEQKGCLRRSRGTKDQLLIDKLILCDAKKKRKNLCMAWIDFKKAFDSVPHDWILKCLQLYGVNEQVQQLLFHSMHLWNTILTVEGNIYGEVSIQCGIFQGDSLSPLLFIMALMPLSIILNNSGKGYLLQHQNPRVSHLVYMDDIKLFASSRQHLDSLLTTLSLFSDDICMQFGCSKCNILKLTRGCITPTDDFKLPSVSNGTIASLTPTSAYRYLGVLESAVFHHSDMKEKLSNEYRRRVRKLLRSYLTGSNVIHAINSCAIPILRYSAGIIDWTLEDLQRLDQGTRKLLSLHGTFYRTSDVDRLYVSRQLGGRGLISVFQCVKAEENSLSNYISGSDEPLLCLVASQDWLPVSTESGKQFKARISSELYNRWIDKALHGQFIRDVTGLVDSRYQWKWLQHSGISKEVEAFLFAAQEQAIPTNIIKNKIYGQTHISPLCRLRGQSNETVDHLTSSCSYIAQTAYKHRHDQVAKFIHWKLLAKYSIDVGSCWWRHQPSPVVENSQCKILWDFTIIADRPICHNHPDVVVVDKQNNKGYFIDVTIPGDARIKMKTTEKLDKYRDLQIIV